MFTTELSRRAMLDPTMVASNVSHLRLCDRAASKVGVASMTPASHGGRANPTIECSRMTVIVGQRAPGAYRWQPVRDLHPTRGPALDFRRLWEIRKFER